MSNAEGMTKSECPKIRLVPLPFSIRASFVVRAFVILSIRVNQRDSRALFVARIGRSAIAATEELISVIFVSFVVKDEQTFPLPRFFKRANACTLPQERRMNITKNLGMLLLAVYLILVGIMALFHVGIPVIVTGILALVAGILILIGK